MANKKKKKKITFPKIMLMLACCVVVGFIGYFIVAKINSSVVRAVSIEGAYKELYVGNPQYDSVEFPVSIYPESADNRIMAMSSDSSVATVSVTAQGKLKINAVGVGTATIKIASAAKSSLTDTCVIVVKNIDVKDLSYQVKTIEEGTVPQVTMQKDGLEHYIPFELEPIDANMNSLRVQFNKTIFEDVRIDQANRRLVVVPKTDIANASTYIDVEINQNTTRGVVPSKYIRIQVNLVEREAHLGFEFANKKPTHLVLTTTIMFTWIQREKVNRKTKLI